MSTETVEGFKLGCQLYSQHQYEAAIEIFRQYTKTDGLQADSYKNMAVCYEALGRYREAFYSYFVAFSLHLDDQRFERCIINVLPKLISDYQFLEIIADRCSKYYGIMVPFCDLLFIFIDSGVEGREYLFNILKTVCAHAYTLQPDNPKSLALMGRLYYTGDEYADALEYYTQIQDPSPEHEYMTLLARLKNSSEDLIEAIDRWSHRIIDGTTGKPSIDWQLRLLDLKGCHYNSCQPSHPDNKTIHRQYNELKWQQQSLSTSDQRKLIGEWQVGQPQNVTDIECWSGGLEFSRFSEKTTYCVRLNNVYSYKHLVYSEASLFAGDKCNIKHLNLDIKGITKTVTLDSSLPIFQFNNTNLENYYHFLIESLARLTDYQYLVIPQRYSEARVILPEGSPNFVLDGLAAIGFNPDHIILAPGDTRYRCEVLDLIDYAPVPGDALYNNAFHAYSPSRRSVCRLQKALRIDNLTPPELVVYVRRTRGIRSLASDDWLIERLNKEFGDKFRIFETGTFSEQQQLFAQAAVIVGPHGAGLSNMIFMRSPGLVVEFPLEPNCNVCFEYLASALGHNHHYLTGFSSYYYGRYGQPSAKIIDELVNVIKVNPIPRRDML